jgi:6-phosphogluconolactonase
MATDGPRGGTGGGGTGGGGMGGGGTGGTPPAGNPYVYVGSGFSGDQIQIFQLDMATGALTKKGMAAAGNPTYLAFHPTKNFIYAISESGSRIFAFSVNPADGLLTRLNDQGSGGSGPAHLSVHKSGNWVLASNYGSGHATALAIMADGRLGAPVDPVQAGSNAHMIVDDGASGNFVFVPSKGTDRVSQFKFDPMTGRLEPNTPAFVARAGQPRHIAFHKNGRWAYLLTETGRNLASYSYNGTTGVLTELASIEAATGGNGAHVAIHPTKDFVYASIRAFNAIAIFGIEADGKARPMGMLRNDSIANPWDFDIDPTGKYLLVANDGSSTVRVFSIDQDTGMLTVVGNGASAPSPHFVGVFRPR